MVKRREDRQIGTFQSPNYRQAPARTNHKKRPRASGRCQSAGNALVRSCCGFGRAGTHRYRGINIPRSPCHGGADSEGRLPVFLSPFHHPSLALPSLHPSVLRIPENFNAIGRKPNGIEVLNITAKKRARRTGDQSPVAVRVRPARGAPGAHGGRYRPIDIDRSPFMNETRRVYGALKVHGTMTWVSTQKLLCRMALRRGVFPTPSRSRLGSERHGAAPAD
jgi:hypothetical protein